MQSILKASCIWTLPSAPRAQQPDCVLRDERSMHSQGQHVFSNPAIEPPHWKAPGACFRKRMHLPVGGVVDWRCESACCFEAWMSISDNVASKGISRSRVLHICLGGSSIHRSRIRRVFIAISGNGGRSNGRHRYNQGSPDRSQPKSSRSISNSKSTPILYNE